MYRLHYIHHTIVLADLDILSYFLFTVVSCLASFMDDSVADVFITAPDVRFSTNRIGDRESAGLLSSSTKAGLL